MELNIDLERLRSELIAAELDQLEDGLEPSVADGWIRINDIIKSVSNLSKNQVRDAYDALVRKGLYEKTSWRKWVYIRRVKENDETDA